MCVYVTTCKCRVVELVRPVCMCVCVSRCCLSVCVIACRCTVLESFRSVCVCVCVCVSVSVCMLSQGYVLRGRVSVSCN